MKIPSPTTLTILGLASAMLPSCASSRRPIVLDSTPRGALVIVDGVDSGHSTPCTIQLAHKARTFEFRLPGYEPEERDVRVGSRKHVVYWRESEVHYRTWAFPIWLGARDFFFPVKVESGEMPNRIHVRLRRSREPVAFAD